MILGCRQALPKPGGFLWLSFGDDFPQQDR
jgi:hypothetical protein